MAVDLHTPELRLIWSGDESEWDLDSLQGLWTEEQYLRLTGSSNHLLEFTDGALEILPMPTDQHQLILQFLLFALHTFLHPQGGIIQCAPLNLQLRGGKFRQPDLLLLLDRKDPRRQNNFWRGADMVVEIVSPDKPERDTVIKRREYAKAGIPEYWIVNPQDETITVLRLTEGAYVEHGIFRRGETVTSVLLAGFTMAIDPLFDER